MPAAAVPITKRALLAGALSVPAIAAAAAVPFETADQQLLRWEARRKHFDDAAEKPGTSDDEIARLVDICDGYEDRIRRAPCKSKTAAVLKLQIVERDTARGPRLRAPVPADELVREVLTFMGPI